MEAHYFQVDLEWLNDRKGEMTSPELTEAITVATPPPFPQGMAGIWSMVMFLGILTVGFVYEWKKGALEWE